ncbi:hypothetical protein IPN35_05970 [Candidatus Peregrinibacteria bacterium]|nr:MAG: hypothetical protein IPN35_05970 [Candidatus Peregrinibacteria bacterium]
MIENVKPKTDTNLRPMYEGGVEELWFEEFGTEPDRESPEFKAYLEKKLRPIDFENRQGWERNSTLETQIVEAMGRKLRRALGDTSITNEVDS